MEIPSIITPSPPAIREKEKEREEEKREGRSVGRKGEREGRGKSTRSDLTGMLVEFWEES